MRIAQQPPSRIGRSVFVHLAGAVFAMTAAGLTPPAVADEPLPPFLPVIIYDIPQFLDPPFIFQLPYEDPNPGGTGSPHTFTMVEPPGPTLGMFYQIEEDGETFGEKIIGFNVPITNPDGLVGFIESPWSLITVPYRYSVTNAHGLTSQAILPLNIIEINHPPTAANATAWAYEDDPVTSLPLSMSDNNGDELTFTITALPEYGDVYAHSVDPANLISAPGDTFPEDTPIIWDSGMEIDKWAPAGHEISTTFEFFASDHEFDSEIATISMIGVRHHWPSEYEFTPSTVEWIHNQGVEYVEIEIQFEPYEGIGGAVLIDSVPPVGEVCWEAIIGEGETLLICLPPGLSTPWGVLVDTLPEDIDEDGSSVTRLWYYPPQQELEPTMPGDPSMQIELRAEAIWPESWYYKPSFTVPITVLPGSCSPEFAPEGYCHNSCTSATPCEGQPLCDPLPGASLYFDGEERFVNLGEFNEFMDMLNYGTVEAWFRTGHTDSRMTLMRSVGRSPFPPVPELEMPYRFAIDFNTNIAGGPLVHDPGHIHVQRRFFGSRSYVYEAPDLFDNHWHHLALRIDEENELIELYIDGVLREPDLVYVDDTGQPLVFGPSAHPLNIGVQELINGELDHYYVGQIDEIRFWDYLRTVEEINDEMYAVMEPSTPGLGGYFPLDEGTGTTTVNLGNAPNATDATLINTPSWIDAHVCEPGPGIPGDLNGDGAVDTEDLFMLLSVWGACGDPNDCPADLDGNGEVDTEDLFILLANWG